MDAVFVIATLALFAASGLLVVFCEKLGESRK